MKDRCWEKSPCSTTAPQGRPAASSRREVEKFIPRVLLCSLCQIVYNSHTESFYVFKDAVFRHKSLREK
ncbi:hypothetical protein BgiMline_019581, partial [Biomphalaria glabrata]